MKQLSLGRASLLLAIAFALGILAGAAGTLGLGIAKARQMVIAQLEGRRLPAVSMRMGDSLTRLVGRELSLTKRQRASLAKSLAAHRSEIEAARAVVGESIRSITRLVYAEIRSELSEDQRTKAESILRDGAVAPVDLE